MSIVLAAIVGVLGGLLFAECLIAMLEHRQSEHYKRLAYAEMEAKTPPVERAIASIARKRA